MPDAALSPVFALSAAGWTEAAWLAVGFLGQLLFTGRFLVQWLASEKRRASVMPVAFWHLSIAGGALLLLYACYRRDPVIITGQLFGIVVYARNLKLIGKQERREAGLAPLAVVLPKAA